MRVCRRQTPAAWVSVSLLLGPYGPMGSHHVIWDRIAKVSCVLSYSLESVPNLAVTVVISDIPTDRLPLAIAPAERARIALAVQGRMMATHYLRLVKGDVCGLQIQETDADGTFSGLGVANRLSLSLSVLIIARLCEGAIGTIVLSVIWRGKFQENFRWTHGKCDGLG